MELAKKQKDALKDELVSCLSFDRDIRKIVIFGSFGASDKPEDLDVAVFQDSNEDYISLSLKYRKLTRDISRRIPIDIFPIKADAKDNSLLTEIANGEIIYER